MCEGQWLEMRVAAGKRCSEAQYLEIIDKKTASLFAFCSRAGGMLRQSDDRELAVLEKFGRDFGLVYQLLDDATDLPAKPTGAVERALAGWGGRRYLRRSATVVSARATRSLARLPAAIAGGLRQLLSFVLEV